MPVNTYAEVYDGRNNESGHNLMKGFIMGDLKLGDKVTILKRYRYEKKYYEGHIISVRDSNYYKNKYCLITNTGNKRGFTPDQIIKIHGNEYKPMNNWERIKKWAYGRFLKD